MKRNITLFLLGAFTLLSSYTPPATSEAVQDKKGMIKVTLLYANGEGKTFDMDYYATKHMPLVAELLGDALTKFSIDKGIAGRTPEDPVPYLAIGYLYFDKLEDYQKAFGPVAQQIISDIPNYTNIQPTLQISEVIE